MRSLLATLLRTFLPVALAASLAHAEAVSSDTGRFVVRQIKHQGQVHRFSVWLPPGFEHKDNWPAIVFLHGAGECGDDGERPTQIGFGPALRAHSERWPYVVVFPQKPHQQEEWEERERLVHAVLDRAIRDFRIGRGRVALAGLSQGGHGVWTLGARRPDRWQCLVPISGYGRARTVSSRVALLPIWAFHGLRDDVVDPNETRSIIAAIRAERVGLGLNPEDVRMTLFADANHNSWDPAFAEPGLRDWFAFHMSVDWRKAAAREQR